MRPVHFARIGLIVASTLLLAQSSPSSFNQKHSESASRCAQGSPIGHNANENVVAPGRERPVAGSRCGWRCLVCQGWYFSRAQGAGVANNIAGGSRA